MSEDVSATMRVGITVILVAALVATVLNLMVMSNSLLSGGQTTLQSGIDSVSQQEFTSYDNKKVSGTQVNTALSLFQGRDVAIVIQTKALAEVSPDAAINYGALLTSDGGPSDRSTNMPKMIYGDSKDKPASCGDYNGSKKEDLKKVVITSQAKTAVIVEFAENTTSSKAIQRNSGASNYVSNLANESGQVLASYDTIGTTELGNAAYILTSSRFSSTLIKDSTGTIIGIFFKQLK